MIKIIVLMLVCLNVWATNWYAGPASAGANNGTSEANQWAHSSVGWSSMASGDTLYLTTGTYSGAAARMNINNTSANYSATNPLIIEGNNNTLDCDSAATHCLYIKAARGIKIQNLTAREATADAIRIDGSDGTIGTQDVTLYRVSGLDSDGCGFQIDNGAVRVKLDEVTGADNYDSATDGGDADGVCVTVATTAAGAGIIIEDSFFYNNSDDGIDLFNLTDAVTVRRNITRDNGYASGDGRGIVTGPGNAAHIIESNVIWNNDQFGIHRRDNSGIVTLRHNSLSNNGTIIASGKNINFPSAVDLNFPTTASRFTDSGVNSEYRALSAPVSSLSVGAQSYASGTVGALAANQYGYSAPYVYVKGNPGSAEVTATPTTQSTAINNAIANAGLAADVVTGLTNGSATNTYDAAITSMNWVGGPLPNSAEGFKTKASSALRAAGTVIGSIQDKGNRPFRVTLPSIGAWEAASGDEATARSTATRTAATARTAATTRTAR